MKVYKCIFTENEVCSDSYPQQIPLSRPEFEEVGFEIQTKRVQKGGEDFGIENNDEEGGGLADAVETVIDVIDAFQLVEMSFTKKEFGAYIKAYMQNVLAHLKEKKPDRVEPFQKGATGLIKEILGRFDDFQFFFTEEGQSGVGDGKASPVIAYYEGEDPAPKCIYIQDGLLEEKY